MSLKPSQPSLHDPFRARRTRPDVFTLSAAAAAIVLGVSGVGPATAEEIVPVASDAPVAVTETTAPETTTEPAPTPVESTEPAPETPSTETPTEPTPTEPPATEPPTTPPPTTPPTETPTPTTPPTETPTETPTPPTTETPAPPAPAPVATPRGQVLVGAGPYARISSGTDPQLSSLLTARTALDRATANLRTAQAELETARSTREIARALAEDLQERADEARDIADTAADFAFAAARGGDSTLNSMAAAFGSGKDLLAGLGGVARVEQITGDADKLQKLAEKRDAEAVVAEEHAAAAWADVDAVPVEAAQDAVADAERAVAAARQDLSGLQTRVAATSVALIDSLPRDAGQLSEQGWAAPVAGKRTDGYGPRPNKPLAGVNEFHRGTDVAAGCGTPVFAATSGIVVEARGNGSYGNWILLEHGAGVATGYAHLVSGGIFVAPGDSVTAGQLIGAVGSTGASTGCHLHFEVRIDGTAVDAEPFMAARGVAIG